MEIRARAGGQPDLSTPLAILADSVRVFVLDPTASGIHVFDYAGEWIDTIGRDGEGPGEFRQPVDMGWLGDSLWVADQALSRLSVLTNDGGFLRSVRFSVVSDRTVIVPQGALTGGGIVSLPIVPASASAVDSLPVLLLDADGFIRDTLAWVALGSVLVRVSTDAGFGNPSRQAMNINHPFDLRALLARDPLSRWLYVATWRDGSHASVLELVQIAATGDTLRTVHLPLGRIGSSTSEVRSYAQSTYGQLPEAFRARVSVGQLTREFIRQVAEPTKTIVDRMVTSEDGVIWFRKTGSHEPTGGQLWVAYRPTRGFLGVVELAEGHDVLAATARKLWTVSRDALGLVTVVGWTPSWSEM